MIWVGKKESEIKYTNGFFSNSITEFGDNSDKNISFCNEFEYRIHSNNHDNRYCFIYNEIIKNTDHEYMFYSTNTAYKIIDMGYNRNDFCCLNDRELVANLNNKLYVRKWLEKIIPIVECYELSNDNLCGQIKLFDFPVIQNTISSGGFGTYLINANDDDTLSKLISSNHNYIISNYLQDSYSANIHIIINDKSVCLLPASVQIIKNIDNMLLYYGADFVTAKNIPFKVDKKIREYSDIIGEILKEKGYRGVCGIDYIICNESVFLLEINPRFQASTFLLNKALFDLKLSSIQEINYNAFYSDKSQHIEDRKISDVDVNYSFLKYLNIDDTKDTKELLSLNAKDVNEVIYDGYSNNISAEKYAYLFQVVYNTNISYWNNSHKNLYIHQNLFDDCFNIAINEPDMLLKIKIGLLNSGVRLSRCAIDNINRHGGYNKSVFNSIDIILTSTRINTPIDVKFCSLSPYHIEYMRGFKLYYNRHYVSDIEIEKEHFTEELYTKNGIPYSRIAFISGDRLRIRHQNRCYYKNHDLGCNFCTTSNSRLYEHINFSDIQEVIDFCFQYKYFSHIMIGGGSGDSCNEHILIIEIISYLRTKCHMPINLMVQPPDNLSILNEYKRCGLTEITMNIEIFDRNLAEVIMPGKGKIPLTQYFNAFERSIELFGKDCSVKSMLIIGLEDEATLIDGVRSLCLMNVQPIFSLMRPMYNSGLSHYIPPNNTYIYDLYLKLESLCKTHGISPGPFCKSCQNNVVVI